MAEFIHPQSLHWYPKIGEIVYGQQGKHFFVGCALASNKNPEKLAIFSRWGFVGLYIQMAKGRKTAINEVRPATEEEKRQFEIDKNN